MSILSQNAEKNATQQLIDHILDRTHHWPREHLYNTIGLPESHITLMQAGYGASVKDHNKLVEFKDLLDKLEEEIAYTSENNFPSFDYHDQTHVKELIV